jgi:formylglycine-generating enzyme
LAGCIVNLARAMKMSGLFARLRTFAFVLAIAGCSAEDAGQGGRPANAAALSSRDAELILLPEIVTQIGDDAAPRDERPEFELQVPAFALDRTPVTVEQFSRFIEETGYRTDAERLGSGAVFVRGIGHWINQPGADWRQPAGPDQPAAPADHPVTQVSWNDAAAFCSAYGLRLPTEFEWERAARLGQTPDGTVFRAGERSSIDAKFRANVWQGVFPVMDTGEDGYRGASPVGAFGEAPSGLTDMAGNVWEWTASTYLPYPAPPRETRSPAPEFVQRGGSFLCNEDVCEGFRATARGHATPDTAAMHVGFRCAGNPPIGERGGKKRPVSP